MYTVPKQCQRVILAQFLQRPFVILQLSVFTQFTFLRFIYLLRSSDGPNMLVRIRLSL